MQDAWRSQRQPSVADNALMVCSLDKDLACDACAILKLGQSKLGSSAQGNNALHLNRSVGFKIVSLRGFTSTNLDLLQSAC